MFGVRSIPLTVILAMVGGLATIAATSAPAQGETLTIAAVHSLKAPLQQIVPMFEREYGVTIGVVYGSSQSLRRQIEKGAAIDVFLPGAAEEVEALHKEGLTLNGRPRIYAQSALVVVMAAASPATAISFHDVLPSRAIHIAVADPKTSALGAITTKALAQLDPQYKSRLRLVQAQDPEEILGQVVAGKADAGIVYRVDGLNGGEVRIVEDAPGRNEIRFGAAVVWTCRKASLGIANEFLDFLTSTRIQKLLLHYGFEPAPSNGSSAPHRSID